MFSFDCFDLIPSISLCLVRRSMHQTSLSADSFRQSRAKRIFPWAFSCHSRLNNLVSTSAIHCDEIGFLKEAQVAKDRGSMRGKKRGEKNYQ